MGTSVASGRDQARLGCSTTTRDRSPGMPQRSGSHTDIGLRAGCRSGYVGPRSRTGSFARRFAGGSVRTFTRGDSRMGSVVKKRRKRMAKKKHRKLLRKTRVQRRRLGK